MNALTRMQPIIIVTAAVVGLALGYVTPLGMHSAGFIEPLLMALLFFVFLAVDESGLRNSFANVRFAATALVINFVWTPLFGYVLGRLFFEGSLDLQMGLVMLLVTPCTDWYLVFTAIARGNVELGTSILPLNLLLQVLLLPLYLLLFFGGAINVSAVDVIGSIVAVLIVPFALSLAFKFASRRLPKAARLVQTLVSSGDAFQLVFLCLAIVAMFAAESEQVFANPILLIEMFVPLALFFTVNFVTGRIVGTCEHMPYEDITSLVFTTLARNSPLSLAIAVAAFPDRPLIALALVIGPLIELPVLAIVASIQRRLTPAAQG